MRQWLPVGVAKQTAETLAIIRDLLRMTNTAVVPHCTEWRSDSMSKDDSAESWRDNSWSRMASLSEMLVKRSSCPLRLGMAVETLERAARCFFRQFSGGVPMVSLKSFVA